MPSRADASPALVYVPDLPDAGAAVVLSRDESHYLSRVCRARPGDAAPATDGRGALAGLRLTAVGGTVTAVVESLERVERTRRARVWCGVPEGNRADWLVEKLAEVGVEAWQPIDCERGRWGVSRGRLDRWRRLAVAAMKQSRRRFLMEVLDSVELDAALSGLTEPSSRWVASRTAGPPPSGAGDGLCLGAVGPAAGFADAETDALVSAGFRPICLADARLRTETAALAWAAWWALAA